MVTAIGQQTSASILFLILVKLGPAHTGGIAQKCTPGEGLPVAVAVAVKAEAQVVVAVVVVVVAVVVVVIVVQVKVRVYPNALILCGRI